MVEAGANEVSEAEILDALDIAHAEIKKLCAGAARAAREGRQAEERGRAPAGRRGHPHADQDRFGEALDHATQVEDKLERQDATKEVEEECSRRSPASADGPDYEEAPGRGAARVRQAREGHHPPADRRRQEASRRPRSRRDPPDLDRGGRRAAHARLGALHPRPDAGASRSRRSAPRARRCGSTRSVCRRRSATSTTTTSRRSRWARPASCAARSAATSATARSPSGRSCRSCRRSRTSRTRSASSRTSSSRTARRRWRRSAARACR